MTTTKTAPTSTALIYVRVSNYTAQDKGRKVSPETPVEKCTALPALKGRIVEIFEDLDFSGKNTKRPGFTMPGRSRSSGPSLVASGRQRD